MFIPLVDVNIIKCRGGVRGGCGIVPRLFTHGGPRTGARRRLVPYPLGTYLSPYGSGPRSWP
jgi:hypothetical protein